MTNHNGEDNKRYNDGNKDGNKDNNAASGLVFDGPIFDPITMHLSRLSLTEEYRVLKTIMLHPLRPIYLHVGIYIPYKYPITTIVNMCHKLPYAKNFVLGLCC